MRTLPNKFKHILCYQVLIIKKIRWKTGCGWGWNEWIEIKAGINLYTEKSLHRDHMYKSTHGKTECVMQICQITKEILKYLFERGYQKKLKYIVVENVTSTTQFHERKNTKILIFYIKPVYFQDTCQFLEQCIQMMILLDPFFSVYMMKVNIPLSTE